MVEGLSAREFSIFRLVEHLSILGVLWGEFVFYLLSGLGKGSGKHELSDFRVSSLLDINLGSVFGLISFNGPQVS